MTKDDNQDESFFRNYPIETGALALVLLLLLLQNLPAITGPGVPWVAIVALILGGIGVIAGYDRLARKVIHWRYTPTVDFIIYPGNEQLENGVTVRGFHYFGKDHLVEVPFESEKDNFEIEEDQLRVYQEPDESLRFNTCFRNNGKRDLELNIDLFTDVFLSNVVEERDPLIDHLATDYIEQTIEEKPINPSESISVGLKRKYRIDELQLKPDQTSSTSWFFNPNRLLEQSDPITELEITVRMMIRVNASEFEIAGWTLPNYVGKVKYGPKEKTITIHGDFGPNSKGQNSVKLIEGEDG